MLHLLQHLVHIFIRRSCLALPASLTIPAGGKKMSACHVDNHTVRTCIIWDANFMNYCLLPIAHPVINRSSVAGAHVPLCVCVYICVCCACTHPHSTCCAVCSPCAERNTFRRTSSGKDRGSIARSLKRSHKKLPLHLLHYLHTSPLTIGIRQILNV